MDLVATATLASVGVLDIAVQCLIGLAAAGLFKIPGPVIPCVVAVGLTLAFGSSCSSSSSSSSSSCSSPRAA